MGYLAVLRIGHRMGRDNRITTHVGLVARAFGANEIVLAGKVEDSIVESLNKVVETWGGPFKVSRVDDGIKFMRRWKRENGIIVHLTMYGLPVDSVIDEIRSDERKKLVVVGAEKVPWSVYELADWNIAIGNQPHSEVSALAIFLDRYFQGRELNKLFSDAKIRIVPQARGKKVVRIESLENF